MNTPPKPSSVAAVLAAAAFLAAISSARGASIPNPSFEANAAFAASPGSVAQVGNAAIIGWTTTTPTRVGLNPAGAANFHADNGVVPNGSRVAFLQSDAANPAVLSTTITGLVVGKHYRVRFNINRKTGTAPNAPFGRCQIDGDAPRTILKSTPADGISGVHLSSYGTFDAIFLASKASESLTITNITVADSTLLVDNFVITEATPIQVTNANNDGPGSLRQAVVAADATDAFNVITFAAALSGETIALFSQINIDDNVGLALDASSLPKGITVTEQVGAAAFGLFAAQGPTHFVGMSFSGGKGNGGAFRLDESGHVQWTRCTISGNGTNATTATGGGIFVENGTAVLSQCTLSGNVGTSGGAIFVDNGQSAFLDQCTVSGNTAIGLGGGIFNDVGGLTVRNSIVGANTANGSASGADITNNGSFRSVDANVIQFQTDGASATNVGDPVDDDPPLLSVLADNGGPTRTVSLGATSPARNKATTATFATDQRGRPVQGIPDVGAYEVQPGTFVMQNGGNVIETAGPKVVTILRQDGFEGAVSVKLSTIAGTASAADFGVITNQVVNFADGIPSATFPITIANDGPGENNEVFTVSLSSPSPGTTLGTPSSTTVTIVDFSSTSAAAQDLTAPPIPVITSPATNAVVPLNLGEFINIQGTAKDNKGVHQIIVSFTVDGVPGGSIGFSPTTQDAASTAWKVLTTPIPGGTTITITARAADVAGNLSLPSAPRTFKTVHPLNVVLNGNGSVTSGFAPRSFREIGSSQTITATPATDHIFTGWTLLNANNTQVGVPLVALDRPTLTFLHRANLVLVANFVRSPFVVNPGLQGKYKALFVAHDTIPAGGTRHSNSTDGALSFFVTRTGAFSGTLQIDGLSLGISGAFDQAGVARFGSSRATSVKIARGTTKPSLELAFNLTGGAGNLQPILAGTLQAKDFRNVLTARSDISFSTRAFFNGTTLQVPQPFVSATGSHVYNVCFRPLAPGSQPPALVDERSYPQGIGFGRVTLSKNGVVTLTNCTLADGTNVTASTFVDGGPNAILFIPLYKKGGFLRTTLQFSPFLPNSDVTGVDTRWARPPGTTHHYHDGWPEVVSMTLDGAIYNPTNGVSVLRPGNGGSLQQPDLDGNATLSFTKGQLLETLVKEMNFPATDVAVKVPANDSTFTFTLTRATGLFSGTFLHTDNTSTSFKGIIHTKPPNSGGFGFFLTTLPSPINFTGESGAVTLRGLP